MNSKPEALSHFPHTIELAVVWNDMDAMNHVNNTVYFRYLETARIDMLRLIAGAPSPSANGLQKGTALAEVRCRFKAPLTFPDTIIVGSGISEVGEHHFIIQQEIFSTQLGFVAAEGDSRLIYYDFKNKQKAKIEGEFLERIQPHLMASA